MLDSDGILKLAQRPRALVVVGAGVIGIEYASMFAALGTKVTVIEQRHRLLDFCDDQITEALQYHLRDIGVTFRFGEEVVAVERHDDGTITHLKSGKRIAADTVLYSAGRTAPPTRWSSRTPAWPPTRAAASGRRALPHRGRRTSTRPAT